jgi:hypothetical protein
MGLRYLIIVLGSYSGIDDDLNNIADPEYGVHYVDGNGIFLGTFYSPFTTEEIYELIMHVPAFLLFDITDKSTSAINLPTKYFKGLFPEYEQTLKILQNDLSDKIDEEVVVDKVKQVEEYTTVNDILDKLSRNNYDRSCLTEREIEILENNI